MVNRRRRIELISITYDEWCLNCEINLAKKKFKSNVFIAAVTDIVDCKQRRLNYHHSEGI